MIPREVREQIAALRAAASKAVREAAPCTMERLNHVVDVMYAYDKVLRILDEHDAAEERERAADREAKTPFDMP